MVLITFVTRPHFDIFDIAPAHSDAHNINIQNKLIMICIYVTLILAMDGYVTYMYCLRREREPQRASQRRWRAQIHARHRGQARRYRADAGRPRWGPGPPRPRRPQPRRPRRPRDGRARRARAGSAPRAASTDAARAGQGTLKALTSTNDYNSFNKCFYYNTLISLGFPQLSARIRAFIKILTLTRRSMVQFGKTLK